MRTTLLLAAGLFLALSALPADAQNPSYEGRGYGGPLYVGPNFEKGGQHTPPVYGQKPAKKRAATKPAQQSPKVRKARATPHKQEKNTDISEQASKTVPSPSTDADSESAAASEAAATASTCKKFDSTTGQTFTVPCE